MNKIRVAICDDIKDLCTTYGEMFSLYDDISFVGEAYNSKMCLDLVESTQIDILLLDICMETKDEGLKLVSKVLAIKPSIKVIMLTGNDEDESIFKAFAYGAVNYIVKSLAFENVVKSVRNVYNDDIRLNPKILNTLMEKVKSVDENQKSVLYFTTKLLSLSATEYEVLEMVYLGKTYKDIAKVRYVAETTIRTLASRIIKKMGFSNMKCLIESMRETGVFEFVSNSKSKTK